jgi:hypothetical protein
MGFVIYPRYFTENAQISNLYSECNPDGTSTAATAGKIQNIFNVNADGITARGQLGSEHVFVISNTHNSSYHNINTIDPLGGGGLYLMSDNSTARISFTTVKTQANAADVNLDTVKTRGLAVGNRIGIVMDDANIHWTTISSITDSDTFVMVDAVPAGRNLPVGAALYIKSEFSVSGVRSQGLSGTALGIGSDGLVRSHISDVDLSGSDGAFYAIGASVMDECVLDGIRAKQFTFTEINKSYLNNLSLLRSATVGQIGLTGDNNTLTDIKAYDASRLLITGDYNMLQGLNSYSSNDTGLEINGNYNMASDLNIVSPVSNGIEIVTGSIGNQISKYNIHGASILDNGTSTVWDFREDNTAVATSGTGEDTLKTVTLLANSIGARGSIEIEASGTKENANGNKTIKLYFGSQSYTVHAAANNQNDWYVKARIGQLTTASQVITWEGWDGTTPLKGFETATEDSTADIIVKLTGECAHGSDTITQRMWHYRRDR